MPMSSAMAAYLRECFDAGELVEGGWRSYEPLARMGPLVGRDPARDSFYAGARFAAYMATIPEYAQQMEKELDAYRDQASRDGV